MKTKSTLTFKVIAGIACLAGFLTISSEFSRSQSEKPEIRTGWNSEKQIFLAAAVPISPKTLPFKITESVVKETPTMIKEVKNEKIESRVVDITVKPSQEEDQGKKISMQGLTPPIPKVSEPAKAREKKVEAKIVKPLTGRVALPKLSPPLLLNHRELQAMANYLDYEILPRRGVRFRYNELRYDRMGHEWFLKGPRDLRGKTVRIDYRGYVPREMTFRIAKSGTSAAIVKKIELEDAPYETRSIFIELPHTIPFREVKHFEFWIERETAGRTPGDFMIEKVVVLERGEAGEQVANESRPEPFPFDRPFVPTNLMRAEVHAS